MLVSTAVKGRHKVSGVPTMPSYCKNGAW